MISNKNTSSLGETSSTLINDKLYNISQSHANVTAVDLHHVHTKDSENQKSNFGDYLSIQGIEYIITNIHLIDYNCDFFKKAINKLKRVNQMSADLAIYHDRNDRIFAMRTTCEATNMLFLLEER